MEVVKFNVIFIIRHNKCSTKDEIDMSTIVSALELQSVLH